MNRQAVKSVCTLLLGAALGWGAGHLPGWGGGVKVQESQPAEAGAQAGSVMQSGGSPAGSGTKAGTGRPGEKPARERVEMLVASFGNRTLDGEADRMRLILDIAQLSAEEIGSVMERLMAVEEVNWEVTEPLAVRWGMLDPKAALDFVAGRDGLGDDSDVVGPIVRELAKVDLPAAKAALSDLGEDERGDVGKAVVRLLMEKDARGALAYARELGNEEAEVEALSSLAGKDPLAAAAELTPGMRWQLPAVEAIASALMARDRISFEKWMDGLKEPEERVTALSAALSEKFRPDAKSAALEAAAWLAKDPEMLKEAGNLMGSIAERWMESNGPPAEVAAWAVGLMEGPARDAAISMAGHHWVQQDVMGASKWLSTLPLGEPRDRVVLGLVHAIGQETPADAFEWALTVESSQLLRGQTLRAAAKRWAEKDLDAAEKAVETLPTSDRVYLRDALEAAREQQGKAAEEK